jgi:hypothetical protein
MNTLGHADRIHLFQLAPTSKGLPRQMLGVHFIHMSSVFPALFEMIFQAHDTAIYTLTSNHADAYIVSAVLSGIIEYFQPNMNDVTA